MMHREEKKHETHTTEHLHNGPKNETVIVKAKAILFDMDGVLISSIGSVERCWNRWADHYGVKRDENFQIPHGTRAIDIVRMLRPDIDPEEGLRVIEDMEIADVSDLAVLPGVRTLLEMLPKDRWAIITSCTRRLLEARLEAADLPVPANVISGDMVTKGKPDAEPYRRGAELLGFVPAECVVIEDAPSGVGSGLAAGSPVLAVLGTHQPVQLKEATWLIASVEHLEVRVDEDGLELWIQPLA